MYKPILLHIPSLEESTNFIGNLNSCKAQAII